MTFTIITQGCKVNQYDSDIIAECMSEQGYVLTNSEKNPEIKPDIVILNTCTVTAVSDKKANHILSKIKKDCPNAITVITGCYPQAFSEEIPQNYADLADLIVGNSQKEKIPLLIKEYINNSITVKDVPQHSLVFTEPKNFYHSNKTRPNIKIEDGCNRFCSYCIIPKARGRVRSRSLENIARETDFHAKDGHREIVLTGINLSCYGQDLGLTLYDAVKTAAQNPLIERIRLSSLEPELLDNHIIEKLSSIKKLCPHFHLSLQSGCRETLKRMNRRYTPEEYLEIADNLRKHFPGCSITTDVMVGFAGETDEEFNESLNFVQSVGFARIHVFTYSVRPGTKAEKMPNHVPENVKAQRYKIMSEIGKKSQISYFSSQLNTVQQVLIEHQTSPEYINGHTDSYIPVRIYGEKAKWNDMLKVRLIKACDGYCEGIVEK